MIATKVGKLDGFKDLRPETIKAAAENSLRRLGVETIDLYYAHFDDTDTPLAETLGGFAELIEAGKVRHIAASNYSGARLAEALEIAEREGLPRYVALQPRIQPDGARLRDRPAPGLRTRGRRRSSPSSRSRWASSPASTGPAARRSTAPVPKAPPRYLDERGERMLGALDEIAAAHDVAPAAVALAWLRAQPTVLSPIASARNVDQLAPLLASVALDLSDDELAQLTGI